MDEGTEEPTSRGSAAQATSSSPPSSSPESSPQSSPQPADDRTTEAAATEQPPDEALQQVPDPPAADEQEEPDEPEKAPGTGLDAGTEVVSAPVPAARPGSRIDAPTTHLPGTARDRAAGDTRAEPDAETSRNGSRARTRRNGSPGRSGAPPGGAPSGSRRPAPPVGGRRGAGPATGANAAPGGAAMPGALIAERYRLVAEVGKDERAGAVLWKARDVMLERDVAITMLTGGWQADARASAALSRATRSAHFEHPNVARVLDVIQPGTSRLPAGILGAAVAEWTPGRDLAELARSGPLRPSVALRVVEPLASAVAEAHRSGLVLGLDHPQRVRVNSRAAARLAFGMPRGDASVSDDVAGLGAALYLLLTGRWPTRDGQAPAGLRPAPRTASGDPVPVRHLRADLPVELAALVDRTVGTEGGIRTAAAVHRLASSLRDGLEDDGVLLPVTEDGADVGDEPGAVWHPDDEQEPAHDPSTRRKLRIGVTLLVVATLAIVSFLAFQLVSLLGGGGSSAPPLVIPTSPPAAAAPAPGAPQAAPAAPMPTQAPAGAPVTLSSVAVYDPSGDPDNPSTANRAADGNPATSWGTSDYRQQFPGLKPGIGIMTTFTSPAQVAAVTVRSPTPGTRIEIRAAPTANVPLGQTQVIGSGTVTSGELRIPVQAGAPTNNLLIWITALGGSGGQFRSELTDVVVQRAG